MTTDRLPLFCGADLAERIERIETQLVATASEAAHRRSAGAAGFVIPIAGGVASFAEQGSPFNKVAGLGFGGVPSATDLEGWPARYPFRNVRGGSVRRVGWRCGVVQPGGAEGQVALFGHAGGHLSGAQVGLARRGRLARLFE